MKQISFLLSLFILALWSCTNDIGTSIDLAGQWQFQTDPNDRGITEKWFNKDLPEQVNLPGSMVENGKGDNITFDTEWTGTLKNKEWYTDPNYAPYTSAENVRMPYWLQPEKKYTGAAWYRKTISIPKNWNGQNITLTLERPHWESTVWINDQQVGMQNSLATAHVFDISQFLHSGKNSITVRIDNRIKEVDPGIDSHSITDHTQSNWNGIVGELSLKANGKIYIENTAVFPDATSKTVHIKATVFNLLNETQAATLSAVANLKSSTNEGETKSEDFQLKPGKNSIEVNYTLGENALLWDEFNPNVYALHLELKSGTETSHKAIDFGFRDFKAAGTRFTINGRPVFLRGTLECAAYPLTGYPPTGTEYWEKIYTAVKAHGLNHVRFHSWCPPEAAFVAADNMGIYLQVECSSWANVSTKLGSGLPIDQYILDEAERIVAVYGNHPSFVMMAYGNEPAGPKHAEFLTNFVEHWKNKDLRRVYTSAGGWPALAVNDYNNLPQPRIQRWNEELKSIINAEAPKSNYDWSPIISKYDIPVVSHEIGQWCVYPNFKEIEKYTGVLKAKNFELFRESLAAHNMAELADSFLLASGKLQALCYKADIEAALRTPGFAGFQLLGLNDFPGQGTALVGVLDAFWEEKGYITADEFHRFCSTTVPLARFGKRIFSEGETITVPLEVAHFGENELTNIKPEWQLTEDGKIIAEGTLDQQNIPVGNAIQLGEIAYKFKTENRPRKVTIEVSVGDFSNNWDCWVYQAKLPAANKEIIIANTLDEATIAALKNGAKVLLSTKKGSIKNGYGGEVGIGFSSIFWNTAWTSGQKPHTLGILCNPEHPALKEFPTEYHSNWQWWDAMSHSNAITTESFSKPVVPIVRVIDDGVTNRQLALLFEVSVGEGKLLVSGIDLTSDLKNRPEAQQLRYSLEKYMAGNRFNPQTALSAQEIQNMFK
ncbi:MAG: sugar-binding domain-containing protein [Draconibacterium sp.]